MTSRYAKPGQRRAKKGKSGMYVIDGLLHHEDQLLGQKVMQLVLPKSRRGDVL